MRKVETITTEYIKLQDLLKLAGEAETGGHAKLMIVNELIFVNGEVCTQRGKKIRPGDLITVEDSDVEIEVVYA